MSLEHTSFDPCPVTLEGRHVRLEPLADRHADDLFAGGREGDFWAFMPRGPFIDLADAHTWISDTLRKSAAGDQVVFSIVDRATGRVVGTTRYMDIRRADRALEIGWTWIPPAHQRTALNTECKYLLLRHAFEALGAIRVQLKTDGRNLRSQRAIERLGAVREGVLRRQRMTWTGYVRDTVYYSILEDEWPAVRARLEAMMDGHGSGG